MVLAYYTRRHKEYTAIQPILVLFEEYAKQVPLELFVLVGSFLEEVISPIPSVVVFVPAGAAAHTQQTGLVHLAVLAVIGAIGRVVGALLLYGLAARFEKVMFARGRRFFGLTHARIKQFSRKLNRSPGSQWTVLLAMNGLPILPTAGLSLACGFVKVPLKVFIPSTFFGTVANALFYLTLGYTGVEAIAALERATFTVNVLLGIAALGLIIWLIWRTKKRT